MRNNVTILKIITSNSDYIKWLGLIQSNIPDHDLYNAIAMHTIAEHVATDTIDVLEELTLVKRGNVSVDMSCKQALKFLKCGSVDIEVSNTKLADKYWEQIQRERWT